MSLMNFLHPFGVARWLHEPQSPILYHELAFLHRVGRYRSVGSPSFPCLLELWRYGRVFDPDNASQYIRYRSYIVRGEIDQKDHDYRPRVVSSCTDMDGFLIRGWDLIHPVSGANSTLARGATLPACWLYERQPIRNQQSVIAMRVFTSCGAVSTSVSGLLEL